MLTTGSRQGMMVGPQIGRPRSCRFAREDVIRFVAHTSFRAGRAIFAAVPTSADRRSSPFPARRASRDPFVELRRMQSEMNRLFSGFSAATARDFPPINIWLGENSVVVTAELPGVTRDDVNLSLQEDVLTLAGKREPKLQQQNVE